jgi:hypothetical protein
VHDQSSHKYVVRLDGDEERGFGDNLDEAIAYATDAGQDGRSAAVWMTGTEGRPDTERCVWPEAPAE